MGVKEIWKALLDEGIEPGDFIFDTEVAAYLLAPTDGSYELEKLGMTYYNQEFPKAARLSGGGGLGPWPTPAAPMGALISHCALIGALHQTLRKRWRSWTCGRCTSRSSCPSAQCWRRWSGKGCWWTGGR